MGIGMIWMQFGSWTGMTDTMETHAGLAGLSHVSQGAAAMLLTAMWQGLAIALCLGICLRLAPGIKASHRFVLWASGFLIIVALPFAPALMHLLSGWAGHTGASGVVSQAMGGPAKAWLLLDARWSIALAALWVGASLWRAADLAANALRLRSLSQAAQPIEPGEAIATALAIPGRRAVQICTTRELERPSVIGFLAPRILIPEWLMERLTEAELSQIILHETEHLRRRDDWTNLLQKIGLVLFPLSPALLWMDRRLCLEREMACDEGVVRRTHAPRAYAACLASLAERGLQHRAEALAALSLGAWQHRPELAQRVHRILTRKRGLGPVAARSLMAALGCSLLVGSVELARCPQIIGFVAPPTVRVSERSEASAMAKADMAGDRLYTSTYNTAMAGGNSQPHATQLKATLPVGKGCPLERRTPVHQPTKAVQSSAAVMGPVWSRMGRALSQQAPKEELVKTDMAENRATQEAAPSDDDASQGQGWIVLTTWEQVEAEPAGHGDSGTNVAAAKTTAETAGSTAVHPSGHAQSQAAGQVIYTRLILRVTPANDGSPTSTAIPFHDGWLVFQL